ncbi:hypothetical protein XENORESO_007071 [Xenotaenia resolanae]|uniref:Secreted protein n=1 Tax=Xenotaenia resolanae TaxID=208358 RepID=A0ABV0WT79_9TELE
MHASSRALFLFFMVGREEHQTSSDFDKDTHFRRWFYVPQKKEPTHRIVCLQSLRSTAQKKVQLAPEKNITAPRMSGPHTCVYLSFLRHLCQRRKRKERERESELDRPTAASGYMFKCSSHVAMADRRKNALLSSNLRWSGLKAEHAVAVFAG